MTQTQWHSDTEAQWHSDTDTGTVTQTHIETKRGRGISRYLVRGRRERECVSRQIEID